MKEIEQYLTLLEMTYAEAVAFLLEKYGPATDDYFKMNSYKRFFNGEIKSITKGNISRTSEGIYCHHIDENKYLKMADFNYIKKQQIPFTSQKKDKLVYCNLIEHTILHALIAKETNGKYGSPGLNTYLIPTIIDWYIDKKTPSRTWQLNCYRASYVSSQGANKIIKKINDKSNSNRTFYQAMKSFSIGFWSVIWEGILESLSKYR